MPTYNKAIRGDIAGPPLVHVPLGSVMANVVVSLLLVALPGTDLPKLSDLSDDALALQQAFDRETGLVRMILIVSPG